MTDKALSSFEFEDRILSSLKKRGGVATAGDVASDTGLPLEETELAMREMLSFYTSHLDVDDNGNLLYRFEPSLKRRGDQPGRRWYEFKQKAWAAFTYLFKIWIMVTLIGYTVLFVALLVAAAVAGIAASASQNSDDRGGGGQLFMMPFYLLIRVLEVMFWISIFDDRRGRYGRRHHPMMGRMGQSSWAKKPKPEKPFYQRIFDYVFGPQPKKADPLAAERAFAQFVRLKKGRITAADWASRTGQSLEDADRALTASVMRFRGDIDVSPDGTLIYKFDDLRVSAEAGLDASLARDVAPIWKRKVTVPSLTGNKRSQNTWVSIFNGFNLFMSLMILSMGAQLELAVTIALGYIPFIFSLIFFAIPAGRYFKHKKLKEKADLENKRRVALQAVFLSADSETPRPISENALPEPISTRVLVDYEGDVEVVNDGQTVYVFPKLAGQIAAGRQARESAETNLVFGQPVFSSDEKKLSLEDAEMADFDRRLAMELGGDVSFDFESEWAYQGDFAQVAK